MARRSSSVILQQIQTLFIAGTLSGLSDRQLLERFLARSDAVSELAFTVLVQRHGPMVLGVCRRILGDPHDAEDAFQATFLVLVRKAGLIRVEGSIGRWLYGVATRVAARAKANSRRRRGRERSGLDQLPTMAHAASTPAIELVDIQSILAEELGKLPTRFQAPVVLCDLEGSSHEEAARRLGWPVGTVKSRLSRARARLRGRLTRRGLAPPELATAVPLVPAALPRSLVEATTRAARSLIAGRPASVETITASVAALTQGVLRTMFFTKLKLAAAALLAIMTGSAILLGQATAQKPAERAGLGDNFAAPTREADQATRSNDALDVEMLERAWAGAIPRRDAAVVNRIMADDFEGIDPAGNEFTKATYMPDLAHGKLSAQPIELDEIKTRIFGDTAVVTSRIKIGGAPTRGRMTNVYIKRQGRWQCVASHASAIAMGDCPVTGSAALLQTFTRYMGRLGDKAAQPAALVNNCAVCHTVNQNPHIGIQPPPPGDAPAVAEGPRDAKTEQSEPITVETEATGAIKINGEPVPAERETLVARLRELQKKTGRKAVVLSASPDTPFHRVLNVVGAANEAGLRVGFTGSPGPQKPNRDTFPGSRNVITGAAQTDFDVYYARVSSYAHPSPAGGRAPSPIPPLAAKTPNDRPDQVTRIRPRFDCLVERIYVKAGQTVRKGEPLADLFSTDLAAAKNDYLTAEIQCKHDQRVLEMRGKLFREKAISEQLWVDTQNAEQKSALGFKTAQDKLRILGLDEDAVARVGREDGAHKARLTLCSPVEGAVLDVDAETGNLYDMKDVLMVISSTSSRQATKP